MSVPDAMHSKTLRKDSPTPICLSDVVTVFSTRSSRGLEEKSTWEIWVIQLIIIFFKHRNSKIAQMVKPVMHVEFLTHPERGSQVGTRLHKSLMTRMTMTAEFRWLTLAWRQKKRTVQSDDMQLTTTCPLLQKMTPKHSKGSSRVNKTPPTNKQIHLYSRLKK